MRIAPHVTQSLGAFELFLIRIVFAIDIQIYKLSDEGVPILYAFSNIYFIYE